MSDDALENLGGRLMEGAYSDVPARFTPFLGAALQVHWTHRSIHGAQTGLTSRAQCTDCPVCGSAPVAGVVRIGGAEQGLRYLACSLCSAQWHYTRIKCSACTSTRNINYLALSGGTGAVKAETCDECATYLKVFYMEKDAALEPHADDLATMALDMLVDEEGYRRFSPNLLLSPGSALSA